MSPVMGSAGLNPECRNMQKWFIEWICSKFRKQREKGGFEKE